MLRNLNGLLALVVRIVANVLDQGVDQRVLHDIHISLTNYQKYLLTTKIYHETIVRKLEKVKERYRENMGKCVGHEFKIFICVKWVRSGKICGSVHFSSIV